MCPLIYPNVIPGPRFPISGHIRDNVRSANKLPRCPPNLLGHVQGVFSWASSSGHYPTIHHQSHHQSRLRRSDDGENLTEKKKLAFILY